MFNKERIIEYFFWNLFAQNTIIFVIRTLVLFAAAFVLGHSWSFDYFINIFPNIRFTLSPEDFAYLNNLSFMIIGIITLVEFISSMGQVSLKNELLRIVWTYVTFSQLLAFYLSYNLNGEWIDQTQLYLSWFIAIVLCGQILYLIYFYSRNTSVLAYAFELG